MSNPVDFKSPHYDPIHWADILIECFQVKAGSVPVVLSGHQWAIIPDRILSNDLFEIVTQTETFNVEKSSLIFASHKFLSDCQLSVAKINHVNKGTLLKTEFLQKCNLLFIQLISHIEKIVHYIYEHLEKRESEGIFLVQHEAIQMTFAGVVSQLEAAKISLKVNCDIFELNLVTHYLMKAVHQLAELGGGRSLLRGNAIELLFHLKLFKSVYLKKE